MTLKEALDYGKEILANNRIENSHLDAWYLLEFICKIDRVYYFTHEKEEMAADKLELYKEYIEKRSLHIPLQHITEEQEFMGLTFWVNKNVLIPRQDTEILVEEVLKVSNFGNKILDMCAGSGCILTSIMHYGDNIEGTAADISPEALLVAKRNFNVHGINPKVIYSNLFANIEEQYHIIVSNPPYIPRKDIEMLTDEVKLYDPLMALDGGIDGLDFYREIIKESGNYLLKGGFLFLEIGYNQGKDVKKMMEMHAYEAVKIIKDLAGLDRVVCGKKKCVIGGKENV